MVRDTLDRMIRGLAGHVREVQRRRNWVLLAAIALFILVVGVLAPGYVANQPSFFKRYPVTAKYWTTWSHSTHAEVVCRECHVRPDTPSQVRYSVKMLSEFYLSALVPGRSPSVLGPPSNEACAYCHSANRTTSPSGDLKIPHKAHVIVLKLKCVTCHKFVVHLKNPEGTHTPRMVTCLGCHNGRRAKNACTTCHKRKSFPVNHRSADWLIVHPTQQAKVNCKGCHGWVRNWCRECHTRRPRAHVARWRSLHGKQVAAGRNCEACHTSSFCVRCHGEVPALNRSKAPRFVR